MESRVMRWVTMSGSNCLKVWRKPGGDEEEKRRGGWGEGEEGWGSKNDVWRLQPKEIRGIMPCDASAHSMREGMQRLLGV